MYCRAGSVGDPAARGDSYALVGGVRTGRSPVHLGNPFLAVCLQEKGSVCVWGESGEVVAVAVNVNGGDDGTDPGMTRSRK